MRKLFGLKKEVNYLYFSFFLIFLIFLSLFHFYSWNIFFDKTALFFLFYAIGQSLLEVCVFILLAYLLKVWAKRFIYLAYISICFTLLLFHFVNFTMIRLLDASILYVFKFFFGSGLDHMIAGMAALNMNWKMILIIAIAFFGIPILGIAFYLLSSKLIRKRPLNVSFVQISLAIGTLAAALLLLDFFAYPFLDLRTYLRYQKTLPLGSTFLSPTLKKIELSSPLISLRQKEPALPQVFFESRPNIFFFVIETFRKDFLEFAPSLVRFGQENIQFQKSYANANATHLSWFSIFHSDLAFDWAKRRDEWTKGSIPLQFLKNHGYRVQVFSSADLRFFQMDKLIFGKNRMLADLIEEYSSQRIEPYERDAKVFDSMKRNLAKEACVYLIFLDSTHSEYSFPDDLPLKYGPISKEIDYLTITPKSPALELVKNRYRNAIHYIDFLMNDFFAVLKSERLYDDAIIVITGDHGEEFFEEGALFHGTHLNEYQTAVPILLKFPAKDWIPQTKWASHIDLFPSIFHYLTKQNDLAHLFDGHSIFSERHPSFHISVLQNGSDPPLEFSLLNADCKLRGKLTTPSKFDVIEMQGTWNFTLDRL